MKIAVKQLVYKVSVLFFLLTIHDALLSVCYAAHPLVTDDTGTQGTGKFAVELNTRMNSDSNTDAGITTKKTGGEIATVVSYGITESADIVLGLPHQWVKVEQDGSPTTDESGVADISLEMKWRFYENDGLSIGIKPGVTLPTGNEEKGLGNGKESYKILLITTKKMDLWAFHLNLGYMHNEFKLQTNQDANSKDLWHASLASTAEVSKGLQLIANIGIEKNSDKTSVVDPAFILGGVIYSVSADFDIDLGFKGALNKSETDSTYLAGMVVRF
jgi:hypothetical protein